MKKMRRFCLLLLAAAFMMGLCAPAMAAAGDEVSLAVSSGCVTLDAVVCLKGSEKLLDTAKGVILYELDSQTMIYFWNPDQRVDPSGMNKLMTALLALEIGDPDAVVTVSKSALASVAVGSVSAGLKAGEEITLRDLLYCMMVGSANDAAAVIAEHIGTSQGAFVGLMNQRAKELGCENTQFMNANGLSHEEQYTTARDLAKITEAALHNEIFVELFSTIKYTVPATNKSEARELVTTNHLMSTETVRNQFDERVTGGKTGALSTTDRSLICTAESDGKRYLAVVMSAQGTVTANGLSVKTFGSLEETRELLDHGFGHYSVRQVLQKEQVMEQFRVTGGENDVIGGPAEDIVVSLPTDAVAEDVTYQCVSADSALTAPIERGQKIGTIEVWFRGICVGQCDMIAMYGVDQPGVNNISLTPGAEEKASSALHNWMFTGGVVLLGVIAVMGIGVIVLRLVRQSQRKRRHKLINERSR